MNDAHPQPSGTKCLALSQRIARVFVSIVLCAVVLGETALPITWKVILVTVAIYTSLSGFSGCDPWLARLRQRQVNATSAPLPNHKLNAAAQLECATIGVLCVAAGIFNRGSGSLWLNLLPFLGVYPILLCAIKYDVLAYLVDSYRKTSSRTTGTP